MKVKDNDVFIMRILGSSTGKANQSFHSAILPENIWILERPTNIEETHEKRNENVTRDKEVWIRWHPVKDFSESSEESRHYAVDRSSGEIQFGDGINGRIPPTGNTIGATYCCGGGESGNVRVEDVFRVGKTIILSGSGKKASQKYLIEKITCSNKGAGCETRFHVRFEKDNDKDSDGNGDSENDLQSFERNQYFYGRLMTVADFENEQQYFSEKMRGRNKCLEKHKRELCLVAILLDIIRCLGCEIKGEVNICVSPDKAVIIKKA